MNYVKDLWKELESESGQPVSSVMSKWTLQLGYPTIDVKSRYVECTGQPMYVHCTVAGLIVPFSWGIQL